MHGSYKKFNMEIKLYLSKHKMSIFLNHHFKNRLVEERGNLTITHKTENFDAAAILHSGKYNVQGVSLQEVIS
jgi:hypothetical protein